MPEDAVAVVDGTEISRAELDELVERAKKAYAAQKQEFPKVGTPEYQNVQTQYVAFLVQREEFEQEAEELGLQVTEKEVDKEVEEFVKTRFEGKRKEFEKALKEQGFTVESFRETIRYSVLAQKLFDAVTKDVKVDDAEIVAYYQQNQAQYATPESRDVRHILVSEKNGDKVDFAKSKAEADRIYARAPGRRRLRRAREGRSRTTPASRQRRQADDHAGPDGARVRQDRVRAEAGRGLRAGEDDLRLPHHRGARPVKEATTTPLAKVRASMQATLLQEKKSTFMTEWVEDLKEQYEDKVSYAAGFEPPELPDATTPRPRPTRASFSAQERDPLGRTSFATVLRDV